MTKVRLTYFDISHVSSDTTIGIITLTDLKKESDIVIVCNEDDQKRFTNLFNDCHPNNNALSLVLANFIATQTTLNLEIDIVGIKDGVYETYLMNIDSGFQRPIRPSDAVYLSLISSIPIYIDGTLMLRQSSKHTGKTSLSLPVNVLNMKMLQEALKHAVSKENYELASSLRDEIKRREQNDNK
jgi:bifunctional DNase/RNase